ncbi:hypothetical protein BDP27DRAFT_1510304 [Rhodocollybia butyracea]|uniref:Uncharacterized protein n=1 Tax=Rhodocollybia butyracea TaxID=206335 RepID=A0A9P5PYP8_9AGAR|nr:hypothetical protein BDP27DRAFT_1510304 [Rhodocollybia butyracea]
MRLIRTTSEEPELHSFPEEQIPEYAILSHVWEEEEVSFQHMQDSIWTIQQRLKRTRRKGGPRLYKRARWRAARVMTTFGSTPAALINLAVPSSPRPSTPCTDTTAKQPFAMSTWLICGVTFPDGLYANGLRGDGLCRS